MSEKLPKNKKAKEDGCFFSLLKGIGCFFVSFIFFGIIFIGAGYYFFTPIIKYIRTEAILPVFEGPTEHDFWSLQEKNFNKTKDNSNSKWDLTHGEFNALLSSIRIPPVSGVYLHKVRHNYKNKELRYYLICSGYMMKKLVISFTLDKSEKPQLSNLSVNSWLVPANSIYENYIKKIMAFYYF